MIEAVIESASRKRATTTPGTPLRVTVVTSLAELDALAPVWDGLLARSRADSVFLAFDWVRVWAEHFVRGPRSLFLLRVDEGDTLVGVAPFYLRRIGLGPLAVRRLGFLGLPEMGSDYLDVIAEPGREGEVAAAISHALFDDLAAVWDELRLQDVPACSPILLELLTLAARTRRYVKLAPGSVCPRLRLPGTHEASEMAPKRRKIAARSLRRLERRGTVGYWSGDGSAADPGLHPLLDLYGRVWGGRLSSRALSFLCDLMARWGGTGRVETDLLTVDGRPLGGLLHLRHRDTLLMYLHVVDRSATGNVNAGDLLIERAVARAARNGLRVYDFLKGVEAYKFQWADGGIQTLTVRMYRRRLRGILLAWAGLAKDMLRVLVR